MMGYEQSCISQQSGQFWEGSSEESYPRLKVPSDQKRIAQWIAYKIL